MSQVILISDLEINGKTYRATGTDEYSMIKSIGFNPSTFREDGFIITKTIWLQDATQNEQKASQKPLEPQRGPRISSKEQKRLERKAEAWNK